MYLQRPAPPERAETVARPSLLAHVTFYCWDCPAGWISLRCTEREHAVRASRTVPGWGAANSSPRLPSGRLRPLFCALPTGISPAAVQKLGNSSFRLEVQPAPVALVTAANAVPSRGLMYAEAKVGPES